LNCIPEDGKGNMPVLNLVSREEWVEEQHHHFNLSITWDWVTTTLMSHFTFPFPPSIHHISVYPWDRIGGVLQPFRKTEGGGGESIFFFSCWKTKLDSLDVQAITYTLHRLHYPGDSTPYLLHLVHYHVLKVTTPDFDTWLRYISWLLDSI
jgi:hypothetical protein